MATLIAMAGHLSGSTQLLIGCIVNFICLDLELTLVVKQIYVDPFT